PILALLDVAVDDAAWEALDPSQRRRRTLDAVKGLLLRESREQPVVLVIEDLHWIDTETQAFLDSLVESLPTARILLLVNYRPEYRHGWGSKTYYTQRRIDPLPAESAEELLVTLLGEDAGLASLKETIIARTAGNPFFIEESVRTLVETGTLTGASGAYQVAAGIAQIEVPATVQGVLAARIDRLPAEDKRILQMAAVIGKDVPYGLLLAIAETPDEDLRRGLTNLQAAEFMYETRLFPDSEYTFKHALTLEVAYGSLLQGRRQACHQRIAEAIEAVYAARLAEQLERLAHHYTEAGLAEKAVGYWQQAGQRAIERSANSEAISHLTKGLKLFKTLPDSPERAQRELTLQVTLGVPLQDIKGAGSPEVGQAYSRARRLCERVGETSEHFAVLWGLWRFYRTRAEFQTARELADELLSLAQRRQDPALLLQAHHAQWPTLLYLGELASCRDHIEQGVALYRQQEHRTQAFLFGGHDPCVCGKAVAALTLWLLGYPDQALKRIREALALAHELNHPSSLALALSEATQLHQVRREEQAVQERAEALLALATEQEFADHLATGTFMRGWALTAQGQGQDGIVQMRQGQASRRATGRAIEEPYFVACVAKAYGTEGQTEEGLNVLAEAFAITDSSGMRYWEAELYRLKGELLLSLSADHESEAEACFQKAIGVSHRQSA
ncbi:MAG: hypothetical protein ACE5NC_12200, partial [Anaerolineae bacterium]